MGDDKMFALQRRLRWGNNRWKTVFRFGEQQAPLAQRIAEEIARIDDVEFRVVHNDKLQQELAAYVAGAWISRAKESTDKVD